MSQVIILLIVFLFPLAYSPGPGNMFFAANGARFGLRATLPASLGYHVATWIVTAAIGLGFASVLDAVPQVFAFIKIAGALYVLWIAYRLFRAGFVEGADVEQPAGFRDGAVLLLLNPKGYVIMALMFTQFLGPAQANSWILVGVITTVFTLNNLVAFTIWTLIGDRIARQFRRPDRAKQLNTAFGVILGLVGLWMLVL